MEAIGSLLRKRKWPGERRNKRQKEVGEYNESKLYICINVSQWDLLFSIINIIWQKIFKRKKRTVWLDHPCFLFPPQLPHPEQGISHNLCSLDTYVNAFVCKIPCYKRNIEIITPSTCLRMWPYLETIFLPIVKLWILIHYNWAQTKTHLHGTLYEPEDGVINLQARETKLFRKLLVLRGKEVSFNNTATLVSKTVKW